VFLGYFVQQPLTHAQMPLQSKGVGTASRYFFAQKVFFPNPCVTGCLLELFGKLTKAAGGFHDGG